VNLANLPNILTVARIVAVPLVVALFYWGHPWSNPLAATVFIAAAITDSLDGYLARRLGLTTPLGEFLDPVADKLMVATALVLLFGHDTRPLIVVTAVARLGLQGTPWLMAFGFLASLLVYLGLRGVPMHIPKDGDRPASWQALRSMGPFLVPLAAILAVRALMIGALTTYLPVFLSEEGATLWRAGAALSVLQAAGVVGALLGGALSDRLGRRLILMLSLLLTPGFMFAFLAAKGWGQFLLLPALGLTSLSTAPAIMALVQESFPQSRSLANGVYMALNFLIHSGAVLVLGALGDRFGLRLAFTVSAGIPLLGLPFLLLLPQRRTDHTV